MKELIKLLTPFLLIGVFIVSCVGTDKILHGLFYESSFVAINESNIKSTEVITVNAVLVFTPPDNVEAVNYYLLEPYLMDHKEYSFLMPKDEFKEYEAKLVESVQKHNWENYPVLKVEQISPDRQAIELRVNGDKRNYVTRYEATDKNIYLTSFKKEDLGSECHYMLIGILVGVMCIYLVKFLLKKFVNSQLERDSDVIETNPNLGK